MCSEASAPSTAAVVRNPCDVRFVSRPGCWSCRHPRRGVSCRPVVDQAPWPSFATKHPLRWLCHHGAGGEISCVRYFTLSVRRLDAGVARDEFRLSKRCATARILWLFGIGRSMLLREGALIPPLQDQNPKAVEIERFGSLISSMLRAYSARPARSLGQGFRKLACDLGHSIPSPLRFECWAI
jgi:hypothetical protein